MGHKISFVSTSKVELDLLLKQHFFSQMKTLRYFDISTTAVVPDDCKYVSFKRCQSFNKATPAGRATKIRRLEKRAIARGESFDPSLVVQRENIVLSHYHSLEEVSQSNKSRFRLNVRMSEENSSRGDSVFSSYGLANSENSFQSVPLI